MLPLKFSSRTFTTLMIGVAGFVSILVATQIYQYVHARKIRFRRKKKEIVVINTAEEWEEIFPKLSEQISIFKAIGLDCEWLSYKKNSPVALIQIATINGFCILIRVYKLADNLPKSLKNILSDKSILKVGVAVKEDGKRLQRDYGIAVNGCVDLRFMLHRVRRAFNCPNEGLQGLAKGVLGVHLDKNPSIRCGNWEAATLSTQQINYAADDACVAIDIFLHLVLVKLYPNDSIKGLDSFDNQQFWSAAKSLCQGIIDVQFIRRSRRSPNHPVAGEDGYAADVSELADAEKKGARRKNTKPPTYSTRKTALYYNCVLLAPDGQPLCTFDKRKALWYIEKELGDKVCDDPLTVKLRFEPSARPLNVDDNYYMTDRQNLCVVCGATESFVRKMVLPQEYKRHFPKHIKSHKSHDTLLLCPSCHQISSNHDSILRQELVERCNAPMASGKGASQFIDTDLQKVQFAARALKCHRKKMPDKRIIELEDVMKSFYEIDEITDEIIEAALEMNIKVNNTLYIPHSKKVVQYYRRNGGIATLERLWRQHFLDTMKPQYLPPLWSVDHRSDISRRDDRDYHSS